MYTLSGSNYIEHFFFHDFVALQNYFTIFFCFLFFFLKLIQIFLNNIILYLN